MALSKGTPHDDRDGTAEHRPTRRCGLAVIRTPHLFMATWIKANNVSFNLDHFVQIFVRKHGDEHRIIGMAPGVAVSAEGEEHWDETIIFKGSKKQCDDAFVVINQLIEPTNLD